MQIAHSIQQSILNKTLLVYGGDLALSAVGIMMSIAALMFMPIVGLSQGAQPLIGFNYGARQYHRVKETFKKAIVAGTCIALTGYLVINIWPAQIVGLFSKGDTALTELTSGAMLTFFAMFPVVGFQIIGSNYFQAWASRFNPPFSACPDSAVYSLLISHFGNRLDGDSAYRGWQ